MISICTDERGCIISLCPDDLTGTTGWQLAEGNFNLTIKDDLFDLYGAPLYTLTDGQAIERFEEERMVDWPPEPEPSETEQLVEAARILLGEAE